MPPEEVELTGLVAAQVLGPLLGRGLRLAE